MQEEVAQTTLCSEAHRTQLINFDAVEFFEGMFMTKNHLDNQWSLTFPSNFNMFENTMHYIQSQKGSPKSKTQGRTRILTGGFAGGFKYRLFGFSAIRYLGVETGTVDFR